MLIEFIKLERVRKRALKYFKYRKPGDHTRVHYVSA